MRDRQSGLLLFLISIAAGISLSAAEYFNAINIGWILATFPFWWMFAFVMVIAFLTCATFILAIACGTAVMVYTESINKLGKRK